MFECMSISAQQHLCDTNFSYIFMLIFLLFFQRATKATGNRKSIFKMNSIKIVQLLFLHLPLISWFHLKCSDVLAQYAEKLADKHP